MVSCSFLHYAKRGVEFRKRLTNFYLIVSLVHPGCNRLVGLIHLGLFFVRLGEELLVNDLALELDVGVRLFQPVFDLEMMHILGKHLLNLH